MNNSHVMLCHRLTRLVSGSPLSLSDDGMCRRSFTCFDQATSDL